VILFCGLLSVVCWKCENAGELGEWRFVEIKVLYLCSFIIILLLLWMLDVSQLAGCPPTTDDDYSICSRMYIFLLLLGVVWCVARHVLFGRAILILTTRFIIMH
jgi:hypothetical protein